jgi:DNA polymerase III epsilon subunit family exonuclease
MVSAVNALLASAGRHGRWAQTPQPPSVLPDSFVVFDLETTGLDPDFNEIIEVGAIRVNRNSETHESFRAFVCPVDQIPKRITELTGITQEMVELEGKPLPETLSEFLQFIGDLPLVTFAADFDMAFLRNALRQSHPQLQINNPVSCVLKMARRAWPELNSYRLIDLARDGGLPTEDAHRALGDCERALLVYCAAASELQAAS